MKINFEELKLLNWSFAIKNNRVYSIDLNDHLYKKDISYLTMANVWGMNSYSTRKKTGCLIVKNNAIISDGYNGTPKGFDNCCEDIDGNTKKIVLHSEANAITKLAKSTNSSIDATIYTVLSPCIECSKLIHQSDIIKVVFMDFYRELEGLYFLLDAGVELLYISKHKINENLMHSVS